MLDLCIHNAHECLSSADLVAWIRQIVRNQLAVEIGARAVDKTRMAEHHKEGQRKRRAQLAGHPEWMEYPRTRPKALKAGTDFFFSGRMCKNRHYNLRTVLGSRCVACEDQAHNVSPSLASFIKDWIFPD
ncbi:hypothetical protein [Yoonia sp. MH D7]